MLDDSDTDHRRNPLTASADTKMIDTKTYIALFSGSTIVLIGLIAAVSLMHLTANTAHALARLHGRQSRDQRQMMAAGGERGDWYVFFHCSDLLGEETTRKTVKRNERRQVAGTAPVRRPRARLSL